MRKVLTSLRNCMKNFNTENSMTDIKENIAAMVNIDSVA